MFARHQVSVDVVATSEVSVSLTLDPKRIWDEGEVDEELDRLVYDLDKIANTNVTKDSAILSLICNVSRTSEILQRVREGAGERGGAACVLCVLVCACVCESV